MHRQNIVESIAEVARMLGNVQRLMMLDYIAQGEQSVENIAIALSLSTANTSQHLQQLWRAGLVEKRRQGKQIYYRLSEGPMIPVIESLKKFAEHAWQEIPNKIQVTEEPQDIDHVSRQELVQRIQNKKVVVLDVRSQAEFQEGHIRGAVNIPSDQIMERLKELPSDTDIVAYCRGPYCLLSQDVAHFLNEQGYSAFHLENGYSFWNASKAEVDL